MKKNKTKWEYSSSGSCVVYRAESILYGDNEFCLSSKQKQWRKLTFDDYQKDNYGHATKMISEEEALKLALAFGVTKEDFYAD